MKKKEKTVQDGQVDRNPLTNDQEEFDSDDAAFIMDTAAEAIDLIAHYNSDFTRETDQDCVSSLLRIISGYLHFHAGLLNGDIGAM